MIISDSTHWYENFDEAAAETVRRIVFDGARRVIVVGHSPRAAELMASSVFSIWHCNPILPQTVQLNSASCQVRFPHGAVLTYYGDNPMSLRGVNSDLAWVNMPYEIYQTSAWREFVALGNRLTTAFGKAPEIIVTAIDINPRPVSL